MKNIIITFIFLTTFCFAQRFEHRESWATLDSNNVVYEVGVDVYDTQTKRSFRFGLPNILWQEPDAVQIAWAIQQITNSYAREDSVKLANAKAVLKQPTVTKVKKNKKYDKQ